MAECDGCVKSGHRLLVQVVMGSIFVLAVSGILSWKSAFAKDDRDDKQEQMIAVMQTTLTQYVKNSEETRSDIKELAQITMQMNLNLQTHIAATSK